MNHSMRKSWYKKTKVVSPLDIKKQLKYLIFNTLFVTYELTFCHMVIGFYLLI